MEMTLRSNHVAQVFGVLDCLHFAKLLTVLLRPTPITLESCRCRIVPNSISDG